MGNLISSFDTFLKLQVECSTNNSLLEVCSNARGRLTKIVPYTYEEETKKYNYSKYFRPCVHVHCNLSLLFHA